MMGRRAPRPPFRSGPVAHLTFLGAGLTVATVPRTLAPCSNPLSLSFAVVEWPRCWKRHSPPPPCVGFFWLWLVTHTRRDGCSPFRPAIRLLIDPPTSAMPHLI